MAAVGNKIGDKTMEAGFKRILFCTDFSKGAARAFKYAVTSAQNNKAKLYILHVLPEADAQFWKGYIVEDGKDLEAKSRGTLHEKLTADYLKELPEGLSSETFYRVGNAAQQIIEFAREHEISLIVLGRPKPRLLRSLLFGSTASKVARYAPCPLLIVPDDENI